MKDDVEEVIGGESGMGGREDKEWRLRGGGREGGGGSKGKKEIEEVKNKRKK